jgi:carboxypeptidase D
MISSGLYCPYIASNMLDANDTTYFNVKGMMINDPSVADDLITELIPTKAFVDLWSANFPLNDSVSTQLTAASRDCGMDAYIEQYFTFPPTGQQPIKLPGYIYGNASDPYTPTDFNYTCDVFDLVANAENDLNPAFNIYQVTELTPVPINALGFPDIPIPGQDIYFNRPDVKAAIHAPAGTNWSLCANEDVFVHGIDNSLPPIFHQIPNVIDRTGNVIITHGVNDMVLIAHGTLLAIQNMTWGGKLGFQVQPSEPLYVPWHPNPGSILTASGSGVMGTTHTERGLTWAYVPLTGHMVPAWQAAASFREIEVLLGRVSGLSSTQPFSIYPDIAQPDAATLGKGTAPVLGRTVAGNGTKCKKRRDVVGEARLV